MSLRSKALLIFVVIIFISVSCNSKRNIVVDGIVIEDAYKDSLIGEGDYLLFDFKVRTRIYFFLKLDETTIGNLENLKFNFISDTTKLKILHKGKAKGESNACIVILIREKNYKNLNYLNFENFERNYLDSLIKYSEIKIQLQNKDINYKLNEKGKPRCDFKSVEILKSQLLKNQRRDWERFKNDELVPF